MRSIFLAFLTVAVLSGCAGLGQQKKEHHFVKGKTTYNEVVEALGNPLTSSNNPDGSKTIAYSDTKTDPKLFIPLVGSLIADKPTTEFTTYTFNSKKILITDPHN